MCVCKLLIPILIGFLVAVKFANHPERRRCCCRFPLFSVESSWNTISPPPPPRLSLLRSLFLREPVPLFSMANNQPTSQPFPQILLQWMDGGRECHQTRRSVLFLLVHQILAGISSSSSSGTRRNGRGTARILQSTKGTLNLKYLTQAKETQTVVWNEKE